MLKDIKDFINNDGFYSTHNENVINEEIKNIEKLLYDIKEADAKIIEGTAVECHNTLRMPDGK